MVKKITFLTNLIILVLLINTISHSLDLKIQPLEKPINEKKVGQKKISSDIIIPKEKPNDKKNLIEVKTKEKKNISYKIDGIIIPKEKPLIAKRKEKKNKISGIIVPKSKPVIVKKEVNKTQIKSKYYRKRDFDLAKKSIREMEKRRWTSAISISKKARDKSIYNFVQWRYLLTSGNQASFYDYQVFINKNPNYPRINRIKYLAEHKLSTKKLSPRKIVNWFNDSEPLSGYGKMIFGESLISLGKVNEGIQKIKEGWITAELTKSDLKFFRKKYKKYLNKEDYIKRADYLA